MTEADALDGCAFQAFEQLDDGAAGAVGQQADLAAQAVDHAAAAADETVFMLLPLVVGCQRRLPPLATQHQMAVLALLSTSALRRC
jgi:hypothetical protein